MDEWARRPATERQLAACRSMGTSQCAALCLSSLAPYGPGGCPEAGQVWTEAAIAREARRRPTGPLAGLVESGKVESSSEWDPLG